MNERPLVDRLRKLAGMFDPHHREGGCNPPTNVGAARLMREAADALEHSKSGDGLTPRTDAAVIQSETDDRLSGELVSADFARGIERELAKWTSLGRSLYHDDVRRETEAAKQQSKPGGEKTITVRVVERERDPLYLGDELDAMVDDIEGHSEDCSKYTKAGSAGAGDPIRSERIETAGGAGAANNAHPEDSWCDDCRSYACRCAVHPKNCGSE